MYEYRIKNVIKVVDGDTIDVDIDLGMNTVRANERIRLAGIDTPESRTTDKAEKALGIESKEYLKSKLKDAKLIVIKTELPDSTEKYGRMLGWLYLDGNTISVNDQMIEDGYAWGYLGDTKVKDFSALAKQREIAKKKAK
jgi:micrococcal nuclease